MENIKIDKYKQLKNQICGIRKDLAIDYADLDSLTKNQRTEIELVLLSLCKDGYIDALECIPYLKNVDFDFVIENNLINQDDNLFVAKYLKVLFLRYKNKEYLEKLCELSSSNAKIFNELIDLFLNDLLNTEEQKIVYDKLQKIMALKGDDLNYNYLYDYKIGENSKKI